MEEYGLLMFMVVIKLTALPRCISLPTSFLKIQHLQKIYGDQAYNGVFARKMKKFGLEFEKAFRPDSVRGFVPVAKIWVLNGRFSGPTSFEEP